MARYSLTPCSCGRLNAVNGNDIHALRPAGEGLDVISVGALTGTRRPASRRGPDKAPRVRTIPVQRT